MQNIYIGSDKGAVVSTARMFASKNDKEKIRLKLTLIPWFSLLLVGVDTDSEDEGLFGKEQKLSSLFNKSKQSSKCLEYPKTSTSKDPGSLPSSGIIFHHLSG